jgi:hypothetical protein
MFLLLRRSHCLRIVAGFAAEHRPAIIRNSRQSQSRGIHSRVMEQQLDMPTCRGINIEELPIPRLQQCMTEGKFHSRDLVQTYLERINRLNGRLKYVQSPCHLNFLASCVLPCYVGSSRHFLTPNY